MVTERTLRDKTILKWGNCIQSESVGCLGIKTRYQKDNRANKHLQKKVISLIVVCIMQCHV